MCDLISATIASTALSSLSAITGAVGESFSESEKAEAVNEANYQAAQNAINDQLNKSNLEGIKQQQESKNLADKKQALKIENMQKTADLKTSSKSSGGAYDSILRQQAIIDGNNMSVIDNQNKMLNLSSNINRHSYKSDAERKISGLKEYKPKSNGLIALESGLKIGSSILSGAKALK